MTAGGDDRACRCGYLHCACPKSRGPDYDAAVRKLLKRIHDADFMLACGYIDYARAVTFLETGL